MCHGDEVRLAPRALHLGLIVARQTLQRLERCHASQESARGDIVVRYHRKRATEQRVGRHGHRAGQRRRGRGRARRPVVSRGRGAAAATRGVG